MQEGGCSNNLELIEDHTNSLVSVEAARVVLHQFAPVKPYFHLVSARSEARSHPSREFQPRLSVRGRPTVTDRLVTHPQVALAGSGASLQADLAAVLLWPSRVVGAKAPPREIESSRQNLLGQRDMLYTQQS